MTDRNQSSPRYRTSRVRHAPDIHTGFDTGVAQLVATIRPTLGPVSRNVAVQRPKHSLAPEILDDGATIARRILALPDTAENTGAMYLRGLLWRLHEEVGDGTVTAAVLFSAMLAGGRRAITAGYASQRLRPHLEQAGSFVHDQLLALAQPIRDKSQLHDVARSTAKDDDLAELLSDCLDVVGTFGRIDLRTGQHRELRHEFVEGAYWPTTVLTPAHLDEYPARRAELHDTAIVLSDLAIDDPEELIPMMAAAKSAGTGSLLIICFSLSDRARGVLSANNRSGAFPIFAVKITGLNSDDRQHELADLSILTGAQPFRQTAGDRMQSATVDALGGARRIWISKDQYGIIGGHGDACAQRRHIEQLEHLYDHLTDHDERQQLLARIGLFQGGSATLWLSSGAESDTKHRIALAERTALVLRQALRSGVVPGGGAALLICREQMLARIPRIEDAHEKMAWRIVADALTTPIETLLSNSGREPATIIDELRRTGAGYGYDVRRGCVVDMIQAGIIDPAGVVATGARTAIDGAALAMTIDALVHRPHADATTDPQG